ncbi:2'-5'-oligoadenylate synthase-like protein 2 [Trachemys scripta elegans]|uniref:2'-5'-oligoadenylate synthase-like protein 2 n=1 Tax=Trachemys scripta elegans TaxID=31138 RepID=UPI001553A4B3|nr:2'-5'-oligoadenylate synthase-like protein 2 [Trachemys scripta elegans]
MELYQVSAGSLDAWIAEHLQPSEEFQLQVKDTVRRICDFLKETCFDDIKVFKTVMVSLLWTSCRCERACQGSFGAGKSLGAYAVIRGSQNPQLDRPRDAERGCHLQLATGGHYPKSTLCRIYAWESATKGAENFSTSEGFRMVMELLCRYQELCVYWTEFYDLQSSVIGPHVKQLLREPCPVILDPADPTGILGQGKSWDLLAREAAVCQDQLCCRNGLAPIRCRDVQLPTPRRAPSHPHQCWEIPLPSQPALLPYTQGLALPEPGLGNQLLLDDQTLASHGIFYDTTVQMLTIEPQEMEIFVKDHNSRTILYGVRASDTVLGLKKKIEDRTGVSASQEHLTFNSKELQDDYTLAHYRIRSKSTVYLLLRFRGG